MVDNVEWIRLLEDAVGFAPTAGLLGLYGFVIASNFESGSTTTDAGPGPNPFIPIKTPPGSIASAASGILRSIESNLGVGNPGIINALVSALGSLIGDASPDVQAAHNTVEAWETTAESDVNSAIKTLWGWVSGL